MNNDLVLAIHHDDLTLHVGRANDLAGHVDPSGSRTRIGSTTGTPRLKEGGNDRDLADRIHDSFAYFDEHGRRLAPLQTRDGTEFVTVGRHDKSDFDVEPGELVVRINSALVHVQEVLDENPELGDEPHAPDDERPPRRHTHVPRPEGTLAEVLRALAPAFFPADPIDSRMHPMHTRGWFHNLCHKAGRR